MEIGRENEITRTANIQANNKETYKKQIPLTNRETKTKHSLHFSFIVAMFVLEPEKRTQNLILIR